MPEEPQQLEQLEVRIVDSLSEVDGRAWNALGAAPYPFLRHEFLLALEETGCLGEQFGWLPRHILLYQQGELVAATPMYLKFNSYGEFVFDWAWADAYQRNGLEYYPKLVSAAPYTPATGPKLLCAADDPSTYRQALISAAVQLAKHSKCSSLHWLFPSDDECQALEDQHFMRRTGCQFHWRNRADAEGGPYADFDDFLAQLSSAKRKKIKRERRRVSEAGIHFRQLNGHTASAADWADFHQLYESTFDKRGGMPTLSLAFFQQIAEQMPNAVLLIQAVHEQQVVAAAFCLVGEDALYGRHWGCREEFHSLHFETCYYQGLDFCIAKQLTLFEPGAQGEHKVSRGFLPTKTWSNHWIANPGFAKAIADFLQREQGGMDDYMAELNEHSPYRTDPNS